MRRHHRFFWVLGLLAGLAVATCQFPTDKSDEVYVTIEAPAQVVLDGDEMTVRARAWRTIGGARDSGTVDDIAIANVDFQWTASNGTVARILPDVQGYATLEGLNPGLTDIGARATTFEQSDDASFPLRVSNFLEIDSVTPSFVKWGDKLTLWGVGVRFAFSVSLPGQQLIPDTASYVETNGFSHMDFWVPQPAFAGNLFVVGPGIFFSPPGTVDVDTVDLYEPNTATPSAIDLDGPPPYPAVPQVLFFNPALAFEELDRDTTRGGDDWYRFARADTATPLTFIMRPEGLTDSSGLFMVYSDSLLYTGSGSIPYAPGTPSWFITSQAGSHCARGSFFPSVQPVDSMIVALKTRPRYLAGTDGLHFFAQYAKRFNYALVMVNAYLTSDPRIQPDRFEENDICELADAPSKLITINPTTAFSDTLNIDNPHDIDFLHIVLTAPLASDSLMVKVHSRPFGASDRSDIDVYIVRVSPFGPIASVSTTGSDDSMRVQLATGDYYVAVVDFAGEATRYSICVAVRFACTPPAASSSPRSPGRDRFRTAPGENHPDGHPFAVPAGAPLDPSRSPFRRP
jgi:hypothetical protein